MVDATRADHKIRLLTRFVTEAIVTLEIDSYILGPAKRYFPFVQRAAVQTEIWTSLCDPVEQESYPTHIVQHNRVCTRVSDRPLLDHADQPTPWPEAVLLDINTTPTFGRAYSPDVRARIAARLANGISKWLPDVRS